MSFMMNTDSIGFAYSNPMFCGAKKYATGYTWLTAVAPSNPVTEYFQLVIATNDYNLAATYTINMVVSFVNTAFIATLT